MEKQKNQTKRDESEKHISCLSPGLVSKKWAAPFKVKAPLVGLTLAGRGQPLGGLPVLVAAQDVVGDVDVAGRHVVDALGDGHTARGGGATAGPAPIAPAARGGGAEGEGGRGAVHPGETHTHTHTHARTHAHTHHTQSNVVNTGWGRRRLVGGATTLTRPRV